ncbi:lamin tail domain-containing protein 1 [Rhynchonycteris naso]
MEEIQATWETSAILKNQVPEYEDKIEEQTQREDAQADLSRTPLSFFHCIPNISDSGSTALPSSPHSSIEIPSNYHLPSPQISRITKSTIAPKSSRSTIVDDFQSENRSGLRTTRLEQRNSINKVKEVKKAKICYKPFYIMAKLRSAGEEHAFGHIKITNIKDLFVKLINSSLDLALEIGNHTLQQNVNGERISFYQFPPNILMQANSTVTVWTAVSEAKHQPPSNFLWKENNKFNTSPNCTTILCKPNGEAIAWYSPIHWKQVWEKLEMDNKFGRCSREHPIPQRHMFHWPKVTTTAKEEHNQFKNDILNYQMEPVPVLLEREKEVPPGPFPSHSPWCHSPNVPPHPYCSLIDPESTSMAESSLNRQSEGLGYTVPKLKPELHERAGAGRAAPPACSHTSSHKHSLPGLVLVEATLPVSSPTAAGDREACALQSPEPHAASRMRAYE